MSILKQVRAEGYREGWSQASMVAHDSAYEDGKRAAELAAPSRLNWFLVGVVVASLIAALFGGAVA
jgi:hypothetical protein